MLTADERAELRRLHQPFTPPDGPSGCSDGWCIGPWPCDVARLLDALEAAELEIDCVEGERLIAERQRDVARRWSAAWKAAATTNRAALRRFGALCDCGLSAVLGGEGRGMLTPDERAYLVAEHTSNGGVCRRCGRNFPCPTVAALDEVERLRAALLEISAEFGHGGLCRIYPICQHVTCLLNAGVERHVRAALAGEGGS